MKKERLSKGKGPRISLFKENKCGCEDEGSEQTQVTLLLRITIKSSWAKLWTRNLLNIFNNKNEGLWKRIYFLFSLTSIDKDFFYVGEVDVLQR